MRRLCVSVGAAAVAAASECSRERRRFVTDAASACKRAAFSAPPALAPSTASRMSTPTRRAPSVPSRQISSHARVTLASSAPSSSTSAVCGRCSCRRRSAPTKPSPAAAPSTGSIARTSGWPVLLTTPHTPSTDTPRKWCAPPLMSIARTADATSELGARTPTGMERPETSSRMASLRAETLAHASRSAKNCGVIVSRNSIAVGTPRPFISRSSSRARRMPLFTWSAVARLMHASARSTMTSSELSEDDSDDSCAARARRALESAVAPAGPTTTSRRSSLPATMLMMACRVSMTCVYVAMLPGNSSKTHDGGSSARSDRTRWLIDSMTKRRACAANAKFHVTLKSEVAGRICITSKTDFSANSAVSPP